MTFTIRAAAELSERFQTALEAAARAASGQEHGRLVAALSRLDAAFVGTIHAFCARLLRERPVEAGVDPGFAEMDEPENAAARLEGWSRYTERLFTGESPILPRLAALGIRLEDLRQTYETLSDNEDVEPEIGPEEPPPDFAAERGAVAAFLARAGADLPPEMPSGGWNEFQEAVRRALRIVALGGAPDATAFARILDALGRARNKGKDAGRLRIEFEALCRDTIEPGLRRWREYLHPILLNAIAPAAVEYAAWRRRNGRLNFQDLLLLARDLLRDHPQVRRDFQARFLPILVDEFQDTDPIQAEILFYLTGEETGEKDWRRLTPRPGQLFVVGDPKQSIYRFRRADIETYGAVRSRIEKSGRVLNLSANFRSTGRLCGWINTAFSRQFPPRRRRSRPRGCRSRRSGPRAFPAFFASSRGRRQRARRRSSPRMRRASRARSRPPSARTLAGQKTSSSSSAHAGTCRTTHGSSRRAEFLTSSPAAARSRTRKSFGRFCPCSRPSRDPDDPVPFVSVLRGPLFGVDDEALYLFSRAGGRFSFRAAPPAGADPRIAKACELLREGEALAAALPPAAAIAQLCGRLGWTAYGAARELGDSRAGNLLKAIAAARTFSTEGLDFAAVVAELDRLTGEGYVEEMGARPGRRGAVRLMTVHGAKGLEAPVVFLADPRRERDRPTRFWIDRSSPRARGRSKSPSPKQEQWVAVE